MHSPARACTMRAMSPSDRRPHPRRAAALAALAALLGVAALPAQAPAKWKFISNPGYDDATVRVCRDGLVMDWVVGGPSPIDPTVSGQAWAFRLAASTATGPVWSTDVDESLVLERVGLLPYNPSEVEAGGFTEHREYRGRLHFRWTAGTLPPGTAVSVWANAGLDNPAMGKVLDAVVGACAVGKPKAPNPGRCYGLKPTIRGTKRADLLRGTPGRDVIIGLGGNDRIVGLGGNDVICGGPGRDQIEGGKGRDLLDGGDGRDRIFGQLDGDRLVGGAADDELIGQDGDDVLIGGLGADRLTGDGGHDRLFGEDGADRAWGLAGNDVLMLGFGDDRAGGGSGDDVIAARAGDDQVVLQGGLEVVDAGPGKDRVEIAGPSGVILDLVTGNAAGAIPLAASILRVEDVLGGPFDDVIYGDDGPNTIDGGAGADYVDGRGGVDVCTGETRVACP